MIFISQRRTPCKCAGTSQDRSRPLSQIPSACVLSAEKKGKGSPCKCAGTSQDRSRPLSQIPSACALSAEKKGKGSPCKPTPCSLTLLAMRGFSGLSFTEMVSLYSGIRSRSRGRFTVMIPVWDVETGELRGDLSPTLGSGSPRPNCPACRSVCG